jgi:hypothetical protein
MMYDLFHHDEWLLNYYGAKQLFRVAGDFYRRINDEAGRVLYYKNMPLGHYEFLEDDAVIFREYCEDGLYARP